MKHNFFQPRLWPITNPMWIVANLTQLGHVLKGIHKPIELMFTWIKHTMEVNPVQSITEFNITCKKSSAHSFSRDVFYRWILSSQKNFNDMSSPEKCIFDGREKAFVFSSNISHDILLLWIWSSIRSYLLQGRKMFIQQLTFYSISYDLTAVNLITFQYNYTKNKATSLHFIVEYIPRYSRWSIVGYLLN